MNRIGWALSGALAIIAVLALARATVAGPLDPPGPVASTMRTVDELLPSWGKQLASSGGCSSKRFTCVLPTGASPTGEAVLDHETGLVWQRVPSLANVSFADADQACREAKIGGRYGWRLAALNERMSLDDDTTADSLPAGHPFTNTPDSYLWSNTPDPQDVQLVQTMTFLNGGGAFSIQPVSRFAGATTPTARAWCVRGDENAPPQQPDEQPSWSRKLDATGGCHSARFTCVLATVADSTGAAVLDHETGLVWERVVDTTLITSWFDAQARCLRSVTGGVHGWRLPLSSELVSLLPLPAGHPFATTGNQFWTMSVIPDGGVMIVLLDANSLVFAPPTATTQPGTRVWCVRGPGGVPGGP